MKYVRSHIDCVGCGECCGVFPVDAVFLSEHIGQAKGELVGIRPWSYDRVVPETMDGRCLWLDRESKRCVIYGHRPAVCRLYGEDRVLPCGKLNPEYLQDLEATIERMGREAGGRMEEVAGMLGMGYK